jgi:probable rRNA maturation factor
VTVTIVIEDDRWKKHPAALRLIRRAAELALSGPPRGPENLTILLSNDARLRTLNRQFRGKDKPTNVLAFTSDDGAYLGDIAIALGVLEREASEQGKTVPAHAAHLAAHGVLHLKGYDHVTRAGRAAMEAVETRLLSKLGVPNPYTPRACTKSAKPVKSTYA